MQGNLRALALTARDRMTGAFLGFLACAASAGYILDVPVVTAFATASAASPLPVVFDAVDGVDYWAERPMFVLTLADGRRDAAQVGRSDFARIAGPHRWQLALALPISAPRLVPRRLVEETLRVGFCASGPLARALGIGATVEAVTLFAENGRGQDVSRTSVRCGS
jgi:hypothetical protein